MAIGAVSISAWADPARARQPPRSTAIPVRKVGVEITGVVAMGRMASKGHSIGKLLFNIMFSG
jgi:hypothetical protein